VVHGRQWRFWSAKISKNSELYLENTNYPINDVQTFDSWIRFQEVVDENEDDDTKAAAVVTQLLHPWSEVSLPRLFCGISGKYSVPSCVRPRNRDTRSSELLRVTPIVGTSDYSCASLIQNSCVAGRPNTTAEDNAIRADDSFGSKWGIHEIEGGHMLKWTFRTVVPQNKAIWWRWACMSLQILCIENKDPDMCEVEQDAEVCGHVHRGFINWEDTITTVEMCDYVLTIGLRGYCLPPITICDEVGLLSTLVDDLLTDACHLPQAKKSWVVFTLKWFN